ncbi:MAG: DUF3445 domain-containing protein, partial [Gammaproteobacteria bacterium]
AKSAKETESQPRQLKASMQLHSQAEPVYFPEADQQSVLRLGLHVIPIEQWLHLDEDFSLFQQHKLASLQKHPEKVYAELPGAGNACDEFGEFLRDHLQSHWGQQFSLEQSGLSHIPTGLNWPTQPRSLWESSLWIQDDICLLELAQEQDEYIMTAASLCSPSNWKLEDKIGKSIDWIHEPVPGYKEQLAKRVNKLISGMAPVKPVMRFNWSLQPGNELCWRSDLDSGSGDGDYYWRVERQTLLKLPQSGAVVFAIRIFLHSLTQMDQLGNFRQRLAAIVSRQSAEMLRYKGMDHKLLERLKCE